MLRQRLLAAVTVKAGRAVQSMGYKRYLPLGDVTCVVENLDRWGADGIVVLSIDRQLQGPDLKLLKRLSQLQLSTPLTYGGGIRTAAQALAAVQTGAERLVIDRALGESSEHIAAMAAAVGRQALIASILAQRSRWNCASLGTLATGQQSTRYMAAKQPMAGTRFRAPGHRCGS